MIDVLRNAVEFGNNLARIETSPRAGNGDGNDSAVGRKILRV
jgi:hypothetical protein